MKILVATDGSETAIRACERAVEMLRDTGRVRVLTVLSYTLYPYGLWPGGELADESSRIREAEETADTLSREAFLIFEKAGFEVESKHRFGNPADEIVTEIEEWAPDLVVLGRRGVRGIERVIGSVSERVVRRADVAMLVVP